MEVYILFKDTTNESKYICDSMYIKAGFVCIKNNKFVIKYPIQNIWSIRHTYKYPESMRRKND